MEIINKYEFGSESRKGGHSTVIFGECHHFHYSYSHKHHREIQHLNQSHTSTSEILFKSNISCDIFCKIFFDLGNEIDEPMLWIAMKLEEINNNQTSKLNNEILILTYLTKGLSFLNHN